ncbi:MAG: UDP-N-acetylmuramoyl-L-alanyl-D-glutamate--2,6-diaminopimelate ligase [Crocinitomicaceae bacterium]|nr:UDP-N-acetylmuramoyl-L-alanyl-D-glutamate--2,6-diaminopimelate ligase [Crocinitomicaceae bacterium]|tara:strand:- start:5343 stop:6806 length:1464 start_codon:yes stop_codon:yes gene_type:complete
MKLLKEIIYGVGIQEIKGLTNVAVEHITFDSRKVIKLTAFVATRGTQSDGHNYIQQAIENGACCIVCEKFPDHFNPNVTYVKVSDSSNALGLIASNFFDNPSEKLKLVGITGTNGKTTSATLLYDLFRLLGYKTGLISTVSIKILHHTFEATHTTPDAIAINRTLNKMVQKGCTHVFMEVSSHAVDQQRISGLDFKVGVFTNISRDHLDYHSTFDNYIQAKKKFFDGLSDEAFALLNYDDNQGETMGMHSHAKIKSYGLHGELDFKGKVLENHFSGLSLIINGKEMVSRLIGNFNAYNLLVAFGVASCLGEDEMSVLTTLSSLKAPEGRFEYFTSESNIIIVVDYAHTPDALENVLKTIHAIKKGGESIISVFGCGGDRDKGKRPLMGKIASDYSNRVIITSDNPRSENPEIILEDINNGIDFEKQSNALSISNRKEAIKTACSMARSGDIVLIAGKGHEKYQIIGDNTSHFDDMETTIEILTQMKK